jgi:predicted extracellular nuclease
MWRKGIILVGAILLSFSFFFSVEAQSGCGSNNGSVFFSEYVEGSSNNKALEIFNGYGSSLDLSNFRVRIYFNGNSSAGTTITLNGTLAPGDVFVLADNDKSNNETRT